jgi:carboxymethylenebutenolidase
MEVAVAFRDIQAEMVSFQGFNRERGEAYYAYPTAAGRFPGVVVIHHFPGWDEWTTEVARKFAHHGYAAIAPNLYFRLGDGASEEVVARARAEGGMPDNQVMGDVTGAVELLRAQANGNGKVAVIGFCSADDKRISPHAGLPISMPQLTAGVAMLLSTIPRNCRAPNR